MSGLTLWWKSLFLSLPKSIETYAKLNEAYASESNWKWKLKLILNRFGEYNLQIWYFIENQ